MTLLEKIKSAPIVFAHDRLGEKVMQIRQYFDSTEKERFSPKVWKYEIEYFSQETGKIIVKMASDDPEKIEKEFIHLREMYEKYMEIELFITDISKI